MAEYSSAEQVAWAVLRGLAEGRTVEVDGLGTFHPDFSFEPSGHQVFIAYAEEDRARAKRLAADLTEAGFRTWMDTSRLLPGQNWPRAIERAIENSDFFVGCFSGASVGKRGGFQAEIRYALDCARRVPLDDIFVVPVRFDPCRMPRSIQKELQYIDLFPDWPTGVGRLTAMMRRELNRRLTSR